MANEYDEMRVKWMGVGEQLDADEVTFMVQQNVEPGFNDHSSRTVLEAYRAGYNKGYTDCSKEWQEERGF